MANTLGNDGMSGAESDDDDELQRVELSFFEPEISANWRLVETHMSKSKLVTMVDKRGNKPRKFKSGTRTPKVARIAPKGCPFNWYLKKWRGKLLRSELHSLRPTPERPIPKLVSKAQFFVLGDISHLYFQFAHEMNPTITAYTSEL